MNTLTNILLLIFTTISSSAFAGLAWTRNSFWRAPYLTEQTIVVSNSDQSLTQKCQQFKANLPARPHLDQELFEELRLIRDENWGANPSATRFEVNVIRSQALQKQSIEQSNLAAIDDSEQMPLFTQKLVRFENTLNRHEDIRVQSLNPNSFTSMAKNLGLKPLGIRIVGTGDSSEIQVFGFDTACDLFHGDAQLEFQVSADAIITEEGARDLTALYKEVEALTQQSIAEALASHKKAALFGYRLGAVLETQWAFPKDKVINYLSGIVETLFDEEMQPKPLWPFIGDKEKYYITVPVRGTALLSTVVRGDK